MMFPSVSWENALRLVVDGFLLAVGWSAGCWMFAQFVSISRIRGGSKG